MTDPAAPPRVSDEELVDLQAYADHLIDRGDPPAEISATLLWTLAREIRESRARVAALEEALREALRLWDLPVTAEVDDFDRDIFDPIRAVLAPDKAAGAE